MDAASVLVADRMIAALASRVWSFGQATREGCHLFLLVKGSGILSRAQQEDIEIEAPVLIWLPQAVRGSVQVRAGSEGYTAFVTTSSVQRTASDPMLAAHRQPFLARFALVGAEGLAARLPSLVAFFQALVEESHEMTAGAAAALGCIWAC